MLTPGVLTWAMRQMEVMRTVRRNSRWRSLEHFFFLEVLFCLFRNKGNLDNFTFAGYLFIYLPIIIHKKKNLTKIWPLKVDSLQFFFLLKKVCFLSKLTNFEFLLNKYSLEQFQIICYLFPKGFFGSLRLCYVLPAYHVFASKTALSSLLPASLPTRQVK